MIKQLLNSFLILFFSNAIFGQQTDTIDIKEKSNPIIYVEGFGGPTVVRNIGISGGFELNYQTGKSLFSLRYINAVGYRQKDGDYIVMPGYYKADDNEEYAFLYGMRWLTNSHSYSVSAGISRCNMELSFRDLDDNRYVYFRNFYGVPFEANYKWFYAKKRSNLVFNAMIPSVGVKLFGSIAKYSFVGVGVTLGFGLSKRY